MLNFVKLRLFALMTDRKGISSMEYAVLAVGIVAAVAVAAGTLGNSVSTLFGKLATYMNGASF